MIGKKDILPLSLLPLHTKAIVKQLISTGIIRRRMLDLGLTTGTEIEVLLESPSGGLTAYNIRGAVIALRTEDAGKVLVQPIGKKVFK